MGISYKKISIVSVCTLAFLFLSLFLNAEDEKGQIIINPQSLKFYAVIGEKTTPSQVVSVFASGTDACRFESNAEWISVSAQSTGENNYVLQIKVNPQNFDIGIYEGVIEVSNKKERVIKIPLALMIGSRTEHKRGCHY